MIAFDYIYHGRAHPDRRHEVCARVATRGEYGRLWRIRFADGVEIEVNRWTVKNIGGSHASKERRAEAG